MAWAAITTSVHKVSYDLQIRRGIAVRASVLIVCIIGLWCIWYMKDIEANKELIAACGLYCGACRKYLSDKCPGCHNNEKASWCKIRSCAIGNGYHSCAECHKDVSECKIYSNFIGKIFAFLFRSDRPACIRYIRKHGEQAFAEEMTKRKCQTIKRK